MVEFDQEEEANVRDSIHPTEEEEGVGEEKEVWKEDTISASKQEDAATTEVKEKATKVKCLTLPPFIVFNAFIDGGLEIDGKNFAEMIQKSGNQVRYLQLWGTHGTIGRSDEVVKICCEHIAGSQAKTEI